MNDTTGLLNAAVQNATVPDKDTRLELYRTMQACRMMEQRAYDLFMQNLVKGTSHLALGQEAVAAGFGVAMRDDDYTFCTYRGHNHTLVRGVSMTGILGELMGREIGLLSGKGYTSRALRTARTSRRLTRQPESECALLERRSRDALEDVD